MTYGGPPSAPESPSLESTKLTESLALIEFIADLRPTSGLLPASPVERARMRRFCLQLDLNVVAPWHALIRGGSPDALFDVFEGIQNLLPETAGFAVGAWSLADVAFAPVLLRFETAMKHEIGLYPVGEGMRALETLKSPRFARLARYLEDVKARPSVKATFNEASVVRVVCCALWWLMVHFTALGGGSGAHGRGSVCPAPFQIVMFARDARIYTTDLPQSPR